jgi:hypothetical protein
VLEVYVGRHRMPGAVDEEEEEDEGGRGGLLTTPHASP